jgi:hypothetical protein
MGGAGRTVLGVPVDSVAAPDGGVAVTGLLAANPQKNPDLRCGAALADVLASALA